MKEPRSKFIEAGVDPVTGISWYKCLECGSSQELGESCKCEPDEYEN